MAEANVSESTPCQLASNVSPDDVDPAQASQDSKQLTKDSDLCRDGSERAETDGQDYTSSIERPSESERSVISSGERKGSTTQVNGTKGEAEAQTKVERRRRRCPVVNVKKYSSEMEGKTNGNDGNRQKKGSLARAVMQGDVPELAQLVREGVSVTEADHHGWTPLHWASSRGSVPMTHIILQEIKRSSSRKEGTDEVDEYSIKVGNVLTAAEGLNGWTALHLATIGGHLDAVYLLMEAGCDANTEDMVGDRPIDCVTRARQGHRRAVRMRNALLDVSDEDSSDNGSDTSPRNQHEAIYSVRHRKRNARRSER